MEIQPTAFNTSTTAATISNLSSDPGQEPRLPRQEGDRSGAICDTLETGDRDSAGGMLPQPREFNGKTTDDIKKNDSTDSGSILDITG